MSYIENPNKLGSIIKDLYKELGLEKCASDYKTIQIWASVVGPHINRVSEVEKIFNGILFVKVKNSAWRNELIFKKKLIMVQLNEAIGKELVRDIIFK